MNLNIVSKTVVLMTTDRKTGFGIIFEQCLKISKISDENFIISIKSM